MPSVRVGAMRPMSSVVRCRRDAAPMIEDLLHLGGVPGHDDIGEETQGIGNCLHFMGLFGLMTGDATGVDRRALRH